MEKVVGFFKGTVSEMKMVTWPSREALWGSTKIVVGFSFLLILFCFFTDQLLNLSTTKIIEMLM